MYAVSPRYFLLLGNKPLLSVIKRETDAVELEWRSESPHRPFSICGQSNFEPLKDSASERCSFHSDLMFCSCADSHG